MLEESLNRSPWSSDLLLPDLSHLMNTAASKVRVGSSGHSRLSRAAASISLLPLLPTEPLFERCRSSSTTLQVQVYLRKFRKSCPYLVHV